MHIKTRSSSYPSPYPLRGYKGENPRYSLKSITLDHIQSIGYPAWSFTSPMLWIVIQSFGLLPHVSDPQGVIQR